MNIADNTEPNKKPAALLLQKNIADLPTTRGEWFYTAVQQIGGKGAILAAGAVLGYFARYGKRWYGSVPNPFKMINDGMHNVLFHNSIYPLAEKHERLKRLGDAAVSTTVLFWGGAAFSPIMKWLENNRERVANWFNRHWGKPGDVEIAHERLKDEPKQTWLDIAKGRVFAWFAIFSAMVAVDQVLWKGTLFGKGRPDKLRFDQYEEGFGRWLAGWLMPKTLGRWFPKLNEGKALWDTELAKELTKEQQKNKAYQFGKITGLDFYATNAGIIIWSFFSRKSARNRHHAQKAMAQANGEKVDTKPPATVSSAAKDCPSCRLKSFAASERPADGYAKTVTSEKAESPAMSLAQ